MRSRDHFLVMTMLRLCDYPPFQISNLHTPIVMNNTTFLASADFCIADAEKVAQTTWNVHEMYIKCTWPKREDPTPPIFH